MIIHLHFIPKQQSEAKNILDDTWWWSVKADHWQSLAVNHHIHINQNQTYQKMNT